jgi:hypothetical protein
MNTKVTTEGLETAQALFKSITINLLPSGIWKQIETVTAEQMMTAQNTMTERNLKSMVILGWVAFLVGCTLESVLWRFTYDNGASRLFRMEMPEYRNLVWSSNRCRKEEAEGIVKRMKDEYPQIFIK